MWRGYKGALCRYLLAGLDVLKERGQPAEHWRPIIADMLLYAHDDAMPNWLGQRDFHRSHKSNLLRKDPRYYRQFRWTCRPDLPYIWPASDRAHMMELH
jgi:hypothetical protein